MGELIKITQERKFTICKECRFLITKDDGLRSSIWYNNFCGAVSREQSRDPYDGVMRYISRNDLGEVYFEDEAHPYVRDINPDGNCIYFEVKRD